VFNKRSKRGREGFLFFFFSMSDHLMNMTKTVTPTPRREETAFFYSKKSVSHFLYSMPRSLGRP
jgi:hypothetical protein